MAKKTKPNNRQQATYSQEFKETAIKLALAGDRPIKDVASELGLPAKRLYDWINAWKKKNGGTHNTRNGSEGSANDELRRLQKRCKQLELENEILKKASAYFARTLL